MFSTRGCPALVASKAESFVCTISDASCEAMRLRQGRLLPLVDPEGRGAAFLDGASWSTGSTSPAPAFVSQTPDLGRQASGATSRLAPRRPKTGRRGRLLRRLREGGGRAPVGPVRTPDTGVRDLMPAPQSCNLCWPGMILCFGRAADRPTPRAIPTAKVRTSQGRYQLSAATAQRTEPLRREPAFARTPALLQVSSLGSNKMGTSI